MSEREGAAGGTCATMSPQEENNGGSNTSGSDSGGSSEGADFFKAYEESKNKPCYVYDVNLKGNKRTKRRIIERELEVRTLGTPAVEVEVLALVGWRSC